MTKRTENLRNERLFRETVTDFQVFVSTAEISRENPVAISLSRNAVIMGWMAFAQTLETYCARMNRPETFKNSGVEEVVKTITQNHEPDELLITNAHYLFQKYTFNDYENPGEFLDGLEGEELERAMKYCSEIFGVGLFRNDIDVQWPILSLDEDVWASLSTTERKFMETFVSFQKAWGCVPIEAIYNFPRTKVISSEKNYRTLLQRMQDYGLIIQDPMQEQPTLISSKENYIFLNLG